MGSAHPRARPLLRLQRQLEGLMTGNAKKTEFCFGEYVSKTVGNKGGKENQISRI